MDSQYAKLIKKDNGCFFMPSDCLQENFENFLNALTPFQTFSISLKEYMQQKYGKILKCEDQKLDHNLEDGLTKRFYDLQKIFHPDQFRGLADLTNASSVVPNWMRKNPLLIYVLKEQLHKKEEIKENLNQITALTYQHHAILSSPFEFLCYIQSFCEKNFEKCKGFSNATNSADLFQWIELQEKWANLQNLEERQKFLEYNESQQKKQEEIILKYLFSLCVEGAFAAAEDCLTTQHVFSVEESFCDEKIEKLRVFFGLFMSYHYGMSILHRMRNQLYE